MLQLQPRTAAYFVACALGLTAIHGETVILKPTADTSIISDGVNPRGDETILAGTRTIGILDRGLLKFDLSSIPAGASIQSVTLTMTVVMVPRAPADSNFDLFRVVTPWVESANWLNASVGHPWGAAGALEGRDYLTNASATQVVQDLGSYQFGPAEGLLTDVVGWLTNPESNQGWLLKSQSESTPSSARHFGSRESKDAPQLTIQYTFATQAPTLTSPSLIKGNCAFSFQQVPNHSYQVEANTNLISANWSVVTNFPPSAAANLVVVTNRPDGFQRFFRVRQD